MPKKEGIEGSGFNYGDPVTVQHCGTATKGIVESIHAGGTLVDIRVTHPGHKEHNRIVTFRTQDVTRAKAKEEAKAE